MPQYRSIRPVRPVPIQELYTVHYFEYTGSYAFSGETHDFWELLYVDRGVLRVTAGESVHDLRQGQLIFHAPGEFHALSAVGVAPDLVVVSFQCNSPHMEFFRGFVTRVGEAERTLLARVVEESRRAFSTPLNDPSTTTLDRRPDAAFGAEALAVSALEELLIRLTRRRDGSWPHQARAGDGTGALGRVTVYLEGRVDQNLTLEEICRDNLIGRSQLQKLFHEHTGGGVMEYFSQLKIQTARRMIREGRLNFTQIAARLGFQSVHYFSRRFRQFTGMSPSEYAQSIRRILEFSGDEPDDYANNL